MSEFDQLVRKQLKTMDALLDLQTELERYQKMNSTTMEETTKQEKEQTAQRLRETQALFEEQTKQIISSFEQEHIVSQR